MTTPTLPTTAQDAVAQGYRLKSLSTPRVLEKASDVLAAMPTDMANQIGDATAPRMPFIVSTDYEDLAGDEVSDAALDRIVKQAIGKTFFLNHNWNVPYDVLGKVESAVKSFVTLPDPATLQPISVRAISMMVKVATTNKAAMDTYNLYMVDGIRIGASITILITDDHTTQNGTNSIDDLFYLETSAVGIPMNQQAWVIETGQKSIAHVHETPAATGDKETSMSDTIKDVPALVEKAGAKHSTDTLDHLNALHDTTHGALDHMNALGVGCAKCMKSMDDGDGDEGSASKAYTAQLGSLHTKIAGLESEKARLTNELAAKTATIDQLTAEKADAERTAEVAVAMLEHIEQQPMPLGQS